MNVKKYAVPAMLVSLVPVIIALLTAVGVDLTPVLQSVCKPQITSVAE
jgi:hypothetical protein